MARSKKILSLVLAVAMVIGVFAINAFAVAPSATLTLSANAAQVASGDTITITVTANSNENYYVGPFGIPLTYDATLVSFVSATVADIYGNSTTDSAINSSASGKVVAQGWSTASGNPVAPNLNGANVALVTFTFTATADGTATFGIDTADQKTATNPSGKFFVGSFDGSNPNNANLTQIGHTLTVNPVDVTIGSAEPNTLVIKDTAPQTPIIDTVNVEVGYNGTIYGIDTLDQNDDFDAKATLAECLTTTLGDDYLVIEDVNGYETTGTIIKVLDADGSTVLETYVFVFFGDVDCDGYITSSDGFIASYYEVYYEGIDTLAQYMAADLDGDGMISSSDDFIASYYEVNYEGITGQPDIADLAQNNTYELI